MCAAVKTGAVRSLGRFTAGLAHDLRNPLNAAQLQLQALLRLSSVGLPLFVRERVLAVNSELCRISELIDDYMSLSEPGITRLERLSLLDISASALTHLVDARLGSVTLENRISGELPAVLADRTRLTRVFIHLLKNSLDALPRADARIRLDAGTVFDSEGNRSMVVVRVSDNGTGIDEETLPQIFEPFFTTKAAGTGLGLTLVKRVILAHGGVVSVRTQGGDRGRKPSASHGPPSEDFTTIAEFTLPIRSI